MNRIRDLGAAGGEDQGSVEDEEAEEEEIKGAAVGV